MGFKDTVQFGINNMVYKHNVIGDYSYANLEKINTSIESNKDINR